MRPGRQRSWATNYWIIPEGQIGHLGNKTLELSERDLVVAVGVDTSEKRVARRTRPQRVADQRTKRLPRPRGDPRRVTRLVTMLHYLRAGRVTELPRAKRPGQKVTTMHLGTTSSSRSILPLSSRSIAANAACTCIVQVRSARPQCKPAVQHAHAHTMQNARPFIHLLAVKRVGYLTPLAACGDERRHLLRGTVKPNLRKLRGRGAHSGPARGDRRVGGKGQVPAGCVEKGSPQSGG